MARLAKRIRAEIRVFRQGRGRRFPSDRFAHRRNRVAGSTRTPGIGPRSVPNLGSASTRLILLNVAFGGAGSRSNPRAPRHANALTHPREICNATRRTLARLLPGSCRNDPRYSFLEFSPFSSVQFPRTVPLIKNVSAKPFGLNIQ